MSYDYYCTGCGVKNNNNGILFDMEMLLTESETKHFRMLKFRLTEEELKALADKEHCTMSLSELMGYMSNTNNVNDPALCALTIEDIDKFLQPKQEEDTADVTLHTRKKSKFKSLGADENDDEETVTSTVPMEAVETPKEEKYPSAIGAMIRKFTLVTNPVQAEEDVRNDLKILRGLFILGNSFSFDLVLDTLDDDNGLPVIVGCTIGKRNVKSSMDNIRVCPHCGKRTFREAGTAIHKSIVFIGYQGAGKTSTILSLTHYAINHMECDLGDEIWAGKKTIDNIDVKQCDLSDSLLNELNDYSEGFAPQKTKVLTKNSYSATLLVKSTAGTLPKNTILTITDLPGELFHIDGTVDKNAILNQYSVATACDAIVVCFDTSLTQKASLEESSDDSWGKGPKLKPTQVISNTCSWAEQFEDLLLQSGNHKDYVPNMLLFTKCQEVEGQPEAEPYKEKNPLKKAYKFADEQRAIEKNKIYAFATDKYKETGHLPKAYQAMLRCSPYGYRAPVRELQEKKGLSYHKPIPCNIDRLMEWILSVTGCIPTKAEYQSIGSQSSFRMLDYYLTRPQYRSDIPSIGEKKGSLAKAAFDNRAKENARKEALARVALFNNPGYYDAELVKAFGNKVREGFLMVELAQAKPEANLREK